MITYVYPTKAFTKLSKKKKSYASCHKCSLTLSYECCVCVMCTNCMALNILTENVLFIWFDNDNMLWLTVTPDAFYCKHITDNTQFNPMLMLNLFEIPMQLDSVLLLEFQRIKKFSIYTKWRNKSIFLDEFIL